MNNWDIVKKVKDAAPDDKDGRVLDLVWAYLDGTITREEAERGMAGLVEDLAALLEEVDIKSMEKVTNPHEYSMGDGKNYDLDAPFSLLLEKLGEPFRNRGNEDYPDDNHKTDVCWEFVGDHGTVTIWNYKNGPAYEGRGRVESIRHFSVSASAVGWVWLLETLELTGEA